MKLHKFAVLHFTSCIIKSNDNAVCKTKPKQNSLKTFSFRCADGQLKTRQAGRKRRSSATLAAGVLPQTLVGELTAEGGAKGRDGKEKGVERDDLCLFVRPFVS